MDKDLLKGIKQGSGFLLVLLVAFSVYAVGFHQTSEIVPGMFQGDYSFNGSVDVKENLTVNKQLKVSNTTRFCDDSTQGNIRYNSSQNTLQFCDGNIWKSTSCKNTYRSCQEIYDNGCANGDGYYTIDPDGAKGNSPFKTYCSFNKSGKKGWTLAIHYGAKNQNGRGYSVSGATSDLELYYANDCGKEESSNCNSFQETAQGPTLNSYGNINFRESALPSTTYSKAKVECVREDGSKFSKNFSLGSESLDSKDDTRHFTVSSSNDNFWHSNLGPSTYENWGAHYSCGYQSAYHNNYAGFGFCKAGGNGAESDDPKGTADSGGDDSGTRAGLSLWNNNVYIDCFTDSNDYQDGNTFKLWLR